MEQFDIDSLLKKFDAGQTTLEEEAQIRAWLLIHGHEAPYRSYKAFFDQLAEMEMILQQTLKDQVPLQDFSQPSVSRTRIAVFDRGWLKIAAAILLLVVGLGGGWFLGQGNNNQTADLQQEIIEIKQLLLQSQVEPLAASYRLDLVEQIIHQPQMNPTLLATLNRILTQDENINVRIAAIEGLANYGHQTDVQTVLIQALATQTDANIQMLLIDILTQHKVQQAKPNLEQLIDNEDVFDFVKVQARQSLKQLVL